MTPQQMLAFAVVGGAVVAFALGRFRYDVVALVALLVGVGAGLVPPARAFSGFTSDVVVIIASALIMSAAVVRSGLIEQALQPVLSHLKTAQTQVPVLAGATAALSTCTKNVGALAILMPVAARLSRTTGVSLSSLLMPMSFMSLLGGLITLVGTSTNIIVSQVREQTLHKPFQMFDFAPVGLVLTLAGLIFVSFGWRLLPRERKGGADLGQALTDAYASEARLPETLGDDAPKTLGALKLRDHGVKATALVREGVHIAAPGARRRLRGGDILVLEGDKDDLVAVFDKTPLIHVRADVEIEKEEPSEEVRAIEAVIQRGSPLVGRSAGRLQLQQQFGVNLLAVSRRGARLDQQLSELRLQAGDVLMLQAGERALPAALEQLNVLPLIERDVRLGNPRRRYLPMVILLAAVVLVALKIVPVATGFFGAAVLMIATGTLSAREAYGALDAQVLILIGALTPLSEAVERTGGTGLIANGLADVLHAAPPLVILLALMATAMACSPFLHNAPTVLVLGPIGVALASRLHLGPDAFLMAVATGAGCDFLTPVGHQCNTLVLGPGGYKFSDYARLGAPLSILVLVIGAPMIAWVWPMR